MKANASTCTTFEIEEYKAPKKLSLQPLFMPQFRYLLLLEKVLSYHGKSFIKKENQMDFSNKSIFIYNYNKKRKNLNKEYKKPSSAKNLFSEILELKKINKHHSIQKNLSISGFINNKNINNNSTKINNKINNKTNIKNDRYYKLISKNFNNSRNKNTSYNAFFSKTTAKKNLRFYLFKKRVNSSDVKARIKFKNETKINKGKEKIKYKLINIINNNQKHDSFWINKREKRYKLKIKKV